MKLGIKGERSLLVGEKDSAKSHGSGDLHVFASPAMMALVEETAWKSIVPYLDKEETSVGTLLDIEHLAATPIGMEVRCETELIEREGRKLVFKTQVYDERELIARGLHERFIVDSDKFQKRTDDK